MAEVDWHTRAPLLEPRKSGSSGGATWAQTLVNIVVSIVGTGVLGLPYAFKAAGWLAGSLGVAAAGLSTYYTMTLLVQCRRRLEEDGEPVQILSYGDLGFKAFGSRGRHLTDFLVFVSQAGGAIAYLIFIAQNLSSVLASFSHINPSTLIFLVLLPLEILLSLIRSLSTLAPFSAFADACNVLAMAIVIKDDFEKFDGFSNVMNRHVFNGLWGLPLAGGVSVFCFEGFGMTLPLEASMIDRGLFCWVLTRAFFGITAVYTCFGLFGYMAYGDDTRDIVTLNLPNDWSAVIVKVGLCAALALTFPIMMHPIHQIVDERLKESDWFKKLCQRRHGAEWFGLHLVNALSVLATAIAASLIPGFGEFISFVGSTVCALLCFVLPTTFHLALLGSSLRLRQRLLDWVFLILGLVLAVYGTYAAASGHAMA